MNYDNYELAIKYGEKLKKEENTLSKSVDFKNFIKDSWSEERKIIAFLQFYLKTKIDINPGPIDGFYGPLTDEALHKASCIITKKGTIDWRDDNKNQYKKVKSIYPSYDKIEDFYGKAGTNLITIDLPYYLKLAWNPKQIVRKTTCHKKVAEPFIKVMEEVKSIYSPKDIKALGLDLYGGCIANPPRSMKGGSKPSTHNWGIAFDFNPAQNQLRWTRDKAVFATPDYVEFMDAWNKQGAFNLGEVKNYDWMHFQFVKP